MEYAVLIAGVRVLLFIARLAVGKSENLLTFMQGRRLFEEDSTHGTNDR